MALIKVYSRSPKDEHADAFGDWTPEIVGSFDMAEAEHWDSIVPGNDTRLWRTNGGHWVLTPGRHENPFYMTPAEAQEWLRGNDHKVDVAQQ